MQNIISKKVKKTAFFILPIVLISGLNFCFFHPTAALSQNLDSQTAISDLHSTTGFCTDDNSSVNTSSYPSTINDIGDIGANSSDNNIPLCCLTHDDAAKIETSGNQKLDNFWPLPIGETFDINHNLISAEFSSNVNYLSESPPPIALVTSVLKKE